MTFSRLFEMGTFSVPWHQRYYDWEKGHVRETGAKRVVTDNTRLHGCELALALNERLSGVEASPSSNRPTPRRE